MKIQKKKMVVYLAQCFRVRHTISVNHQLFYWLTDGTYIYQASIAIIITNQSVQNTTKNRRDTEKKAIQTKLDGLMGRGRSSFDRKSTGKNIMLVCSHIECIIYSIASMKLYQISNTKKTTNKQRKLHIVCLHVCSEVHCVPFYIRIRLDYFALFQWKIMVS